MVKKLEAKKGFKTVIRINKILWPLRKILLPVNSNALVLDVGSGGDPYPRADVVLDRLTGAQHRCGEAMTIDRHAVYADACEMPFKDKSFDFIVASHILEHMSDPDKFLRELMRVGKAGYIETPNAIFERLYPYEIHCLEILHIKNRLLIRKKERALGDDFLGDKRLMAEGTHWNSHLHNQPQMYHVRYFWTETVDYSIENPEISCRWIEAVNADSSRGKIKSNSELDGRRGWRAFGLNIINSWQSFRRKKRLKNFDFFAIVMCPYCRSDILKTNEYLECSKCQIRFPMVDGVPDFTHNFLDG